MLAVIAPHYRKGERGRPPIGLGRMLRIYFFQLTITPTCTAGCAPSILA